METAERNIVALREAQRSAFDALLREEKDVSRFVDDFARRRGSSAWARIHRIPCGRTSGRTARERSRADARTGPIADDHPPRATGWERGRWNRGAAGRRIGRRRRDRTVEKTTTRRVRPRLRLAESVRVVPRLLVRVRGRAAQTRRPREPPRDVRSAAAAAAAPAAPAGFGDAAFRPGGGTTGGWADVDHARARRCLARCNMNYGAATVMAADELAAFGIERAEVVRPRVGTRSALRAEGKNEGVGARVARPQRYDAAAQRRRRTRNAARRRPRKRKAAARAAARENAREAALRGGGRGNARRRPTSPRRAPPPPPAEKAARPRARDELSANAPNATRETPSARRRGGRCKKRRGKRRRRRRRRSSLRRRNKPPPRPRRTAIASKPGCASRRRGDARRRRRTWHSKRARRGRRRRRRNFARRRLAGDHV